MVTLCLVFLTLLKAFNNNFSNQPKFYNDWKNFNSSNFPLEFNDANWNEIMTVEIKDPYHSFNKFYNKLDNLIKKYVPVKKLSKKQLKRKSKPWITKGLIKSMQVRDNIFHKFLRAKDVNNKVQHQSKYKRYRNLITILIKLSKKLYYDHFNPNRNNSKVTWETINELLNKKPKNSIDDIILDINGNKQNDPSDIANEFNEFFTNIASKIQAEIPVLGNFEDFVAKPNFGNSFFFKPVTSFEVMKIPNQKHRLIQYSKKIIKAIPKTLSLIIKELNLLNSNLSRFS